MEKLYGFLGEFFATRARKLALARFYRENPTFLQSRYVEKRYVFRMAKLHGKRGFWLDLRGH